jgi:hypothetical protein
VETIGLLVIVTGSNVLYIVTVDPTGQTNTVYGVLGAKPEIL